MTPERYQQIDQIFQAALEHEPAKRAAFLDEACSGDETLRQEVESLITSDRGGLSFIDEPAFEMAAHLLASDEPELAVGEHVDRYEILSLLGSGGMGEVYLAHDEKLDRKIALKLLPFGFTTNQNRLHRFQQEARAASALNHPNIITIYEIGTVEDRHFIATEFVDGETLRQRMRRGALSLHESLDIAIQVCSALAAAHKAGIVHRDIKPENIMLRPDGYVKVLDFGLAKLTEQYEPATVAGAADNVDISSGLVMGTVKYMSPEQAQGIHVDQRSDIFSLGVVLYEIVGGHAPFQGETVGELVASILKNEPPPLADHLPEVPDGVQRIINTALCKDKNARYQSIEDLRIDLEHVKDELELEAKFQRSGAPITRRGEAVSISEVRAAAQTAEEFTVSTRDIEPISSTSNAQYLVAEIKRHKMRAAIAFVILFLSTTSIGYAIYKILGKSNFRTSAQNVRLARLTATGKAFNAAISPDGKYVAFVTSDSNKPNAGQTSLWIRELATNTNVQIFPPSTHSYWGLTFSRDSNLLYYFDRDKDDPEPTLYQVPAVGGASQKVFTGTINASTSGAISISSNGNRLVFVREYPSGESAVVTANADGSDERKVASRQGNSVFTKAAWSPDGNRIACAASKQDPKGLYYELIEMDAQGGSEKPISLQRWLSIDDLVWLSDGSGLLITATDEESAFGEIWEIPYPSGDARKLTTDFNAYSGLSLTEDSSVLVTTLGETIQNVWMQPADDPTGAKQITTGAASKDGWDGMAWTPDGRIVYSSFANGNPDIWIMDADGGNQKQLTANLGSTYFGLSVSDDGRYIAIVSRRAGHANIWRIDIDGSRPRQLTSGNTEWNPVFSPDGWIGYNCEISGKKARCKVPIEGGDAVQVTGPYSDMMRFSPDGKLVAFIPGEDQGKGKRIGVVPVDESAPARIFDLPSGAMPRRMQWSADSRALTYVDTRRGTANIWSLPIEGGNAVQVTDFKDHFISTFSWSRDGKQLAMARSTATNDVVLMRNFR
jgi:serine/threonine protein kinase